jgi:hypothetical protein
MFRGRRVRILRNAWAVCKDENEGESTRQDNDETGLPKVIRLALSQYPTTTIQSNATMHDMVPPAPLLP